jgi:hypothetical protein
MKHRSAPARDARRFAAVAARARRAIEDARRTVKQSEVLAAAMSLERDSERLLIRYAWCDRYSLGGEWMKASELPHVWGVGKKLRDERVTHSICPECMATAW